MPGTVPSKVPGTVPSTVPSGIAPSAAVVYIQDCTEQGDPRISELQRRSGHGLPTEPYLATELVKGVGGAPTSLRLGGGNGGEYRKTFHGYPPGFVQVASYFKHIGYP